MENDLLLNSKYKEGLIGLEINLRNRQHEIFAQRFKKFKYDYKSNSTKTIFDIVVCDKENLKNHVYELWVEDSFKGHAFFVKIKKEIMHRLWQMKTKQR